MDRKTLRAIIENEEFDTNTKIGNILTAYHDEIADIKGSFKTEDDVQMAVAEALKNAPPKTVKVAETEEYKALQKQLDDYKYSTDVKGKLKGLKVKEKFMEDVISKIKREENAEDVDKQVSKIKETFAEYFDDDGTTPPPAPKPVFGAPTLPTEPPTAKPIPKIF